MWPKKEKGPHLILVGKLGKLLRIWKNTSAELEQILRKIRKKYSETLKNYSQKTGSWRRNYFSNYAVVKTIWFWIWLDWLIKKIKLKFQLVWLLCKKVKGRLFWTSKNQKVIILNNFQNFQIIKIGHLTIIIKIDFYT